MFNFIRNLIADLKSERHRRIENRIAQSIYAGVATEYARDADHMMLTAKLASALNNYNLGHTTFYGKRIPGKSPVIDFKADGVEVLRYPLAKAIIISLATSKGKVVYEKVALLDAKKEWRSEMWDFDESFQFFYMNFPSFSDASGIFEKRKEVAFPNHGRQLGYFGLFSQAGSFAIMDAETFNYYDKNSTVSKSNIERITARFSDGISTNSVALNYIFSDQSQKENEITIHDLHRYPVLNKCNYARNPYEFVRSLLRFNIGEEVIVDGIVIDETLKDFAHLMLVKAGYTSQFQDALDLPEIKLSGELEEICVIVNHFDADKSA